MNKTIYLINKIIQKSQSCSAVIKSSESNIGVNLGTAFNVVI